MNAMNGHFGAGNFQQGVHAKSYAAKMSCYVDVTKKATGVMSMPDGFPSGGRSMRRLEASCQVEESHHYHRSRKMKEKGGGDDEMNVVVFLGRTVETLSTHT